MRNWLPITRKQYNYALISFLTGIFLGFTLFIWGIVIDGGLFIYYGDYNAQQIPFYQMVHDSVLNGETMWSNKTDLGANLIGSYSFYLISSPFFLFTLLFPSGAVPYLMAPLLILKLGLASLGSFYYLRRYFSHPGYAVLGSMLYAFSGFSLYNIFFNHFHEAIVVFPFLLYAIDEFMYKKRKGIVALGVFASSVMNYYFFVGMVVFVIIYWVIRICTRSFPKIKFKELCLLAFEVLIGFGMALFILLPAVLTVTQNYRITEWPNGWGAVLYNVNQRYLHIIESFFFPPDIAARPNFTPDSQSNWASIAGWLPMVGVSGVIGLLQNKKAHWLKKLLPLLLVCALVPIFNAAFQGFNMNYYARWFYMPTLMMSLAAVQAIDDSDTDWLRAVRLTAGITVVILCLVGLMPYTDYSESNDGITKIGLENYPERLWIYGAISLAGLCCFSLLIKLYKNNRRIFLKASFTALAVIIFIYGNFIIYTGRLQTGSSGEFIMDHALKSEDNLDLDDIENVRSDYYYCIDNLGMLLKTPNIQAFHSVVPGSIMDFYPKFGVGRDVHSKPDTTRYALRGLLSVKYLFDDAYDDNDFYQDHKTQMPGWEYLDNKNGLVIYENKYYIPMGFMYNDFVSEEEFELISEDNRDKAVLKAMVLDKKLLKKYQDITGYTDEELKKLDSVISSEKNDGTSNFTDYHGIVSTFKYEEEDYYKDALARKAQSCSDFEYVNNGFKASIDNKGEENLLFFSVPYEDGWTATVNGKECKIEKVNYGFMAVKIPANKISEIEFTYRTPGLTLGLIISTICFTAFIVYIFLIIFIKRRKA